MAQTGEETAYPTDRLEPSPRYSAKGSTVRSMSPLRFLRATRFAGAVACLAMTRLVRATAVGGAVGALALVGAASRRARGAPATGWV